MGKAEEENKIVLKWLLWGVIYLLIFFGLTFLNEKYNFSIFPEPYEKVGVITLIICLVFILLITNIRKTIKKDRHKKQEENN
ncbi:hypothetical protein GCM10007424_02380 [Flavobacterium suaedae]|uniref:Uncharacterized protein n=1 Tax=Flavobacterium suaedae TaxID=1767027 RepID=A0ABQ1JGV2_9FLAO|nr:hypothetical protein [Flavobacterium suaedae]GGB65963.1 hypothetical protein GCM10007424_02380 [Flavobacterium suaedae]